jgi:hypothetical protein
MLGIVLSVAILATNAQAIDDLKVTIKYSLEVEDGGAYWQKISGTPFGAGDVEYVVDTVDSTDPKVDVLVDNPLLVTMEFTADDWGNIVDGPVYLTNTHFEREFAINSGVTATTTLSTNLSRTATGNLSGSTITWDNDSGVNAYQEDVDGYVDCEPPGGFCTLAGLPKDVSGVNEVPLPKFTILTDSAFADGFVSDNGTPGTPADDINRPDPGATVKDTWHGVEISRKVSYVVPAISEIYLLVGALGLVGLGCLRGRGGVSA